jgi:alkanesulfonate monooxygenase SsuD/methylene tetrahydromethanopterin reductase-like flavin-dependent oxidoreductase (luciferase family)
MQVGVGLPTAIPDTPEHTVVEWARAADRGPFGSLGVLDRILFDNYEPITALSAAAAVTERITLAATIVIGPLRPNALLAKQAAALNALSGGRLVLGLGLGAREDDYLVSGVEYHARGRLLTEQLEFLRDTWERRAAGPASGVSPPPRLLVGGAGGAGLRRMARFADGYVHGGGPPRAFARAAAEARAAWEDAGRQGVPELWGMAYFAFERVVEGAEYLRSYYAFTGAFADRIAAGLLTGRESILECIQGYAEAGCTNLILFPTVADMSQLARLAEVISG